MRHDKITDEALDHLQSIKEETDRSLYDKYTHGCIEHGGGLWKYPVYELAKEAHNETIDQLTYITTLMQNLNSVSDILFTNYDSCEVCKQVYDTLFRGIK